MQFRTPDGRIIEAKTSGQVAYYRREPGFEVLEGGAAVPASADEVPVGPADGVSVDDTPDPAKAEKSSSKRDRDGGE